MLYIFLASGRLPRDGLLPITGLEKKKKDNSLIEQTSNGPSVFAQGLEFAVDIDK